MYGFTSENRRDVDDVVLTSHVSCFYRTSILGTILCTSGFLNDFFFRSHGPKHKLYWLNSTRRLFRDLRYF